MSYLGDLTFRLVAGAMQLDDSFRSRHAEYLAGSQRADGGFAGRQGESDPYYTGFALRGLLLLGALPQEAAERAASFLEKSITRDLGAVDFLSAVFSALLLETACGIDLFARAPVDRLEEVGRQLAPLRREDGGFVKTRQSGRSSTYQTFLSVSCLQLVGAEIQDQEGIVRLVRSRRRADGGYAELDPIDRGGTNPTAAAIALLRLLSSEPAAKLSAEEREQSIAFLAQMQTPEGGLRANTRIPIADLLSTCTGMIALADLDGLGRVDLSLAARFLTAMERESGGFRGGGWDEDVDAEYTFYGVACGALLKTAGL